MAYICIQYDLSHFLHFSMSNNQSDAPVNVIMIHTINDIVESKLLWGSSDLTCFSLITVHTHHDGPNQSTQKFKVSEMRNTPIS